MNDYDDDPDPRQCACPSADARRCVELRYPRYMLDDSDHERDGDESGEACRCDCHEPDDDEPDFWER